MLTSVRMRTENELRRWRLRQLSFAELNIMSKPAPDASLVRKFFSTGYCFIHIPKNGGTTIESLLYGQKVGHRPWYEIYKLAPFGYPAWWKFCVAREPFDRFLSSYDYLKKGGRNDIDAEVGRRFIKNMEINDFVRCFDDRRFRTEIMQYFHFRPQADFVLSGDGHCMINTILPFDRLNEEIAVFLDISQGSVEHRNKTPGLRTPVDALSARSKAKINGLYPMDFALYDCAQTTSEDLFMVRL